MPRLLPLTFALAALLACQARRPQATTPRWETVRSVEGRFQVDFPGKPELDVQGAVKGSTGHSLSVSLPGHVSFAVAYSDIANLHVDADGARALYAKWSEALAEALGGERSASEAVTMGKRQGWRLRLAGKDKVTEARALLVGNRLFQLLAFFPPGEAHEAAATRMFRSFAPLEGAQAAGTGR